MSSPSSSSSSSTDSVGNSSNELVYALVFIVLFVPLLVLLSLQIYRAIRFLKNRDRSWRVFWVSLTTSQKRAAGTENTAASTQASTTSGAVRRLNVHLLIKLSFALLCTVRILQGILFLGDIYTYGTMLGLDSAIRYWIPYICSTMLFSCICLTLAYWSELAMAAHELLNQPSFLTRPLVGSLILLNVIAHLLTLILIGVYLQPSTQTTMITGDAATQMLQILYTVVLAIPMLVCVGVLAVYLRLRMREAMKETAQNKPALQRARRKMGYFTLVALASMVLRVLIYIWQSAAPLSNVDLAATLVFITNAIPEVVLGITLIVLTWVPKRVLRPTEQETEGTGEGEEEVSLIAPEVVHAVGAQ